MSELCAGEAAFWGVARFLGEALIVVFAGFCSVSAPGLAKTTERRIGKRIAQLAPASQEELDRSIFLGIIKPVHLARLWCPHLHDSCHYFDCLGGGGLSFFRDARKKLKPFGL